MYYNWIVKYFSWSNEKNAWLKRERNISFEDVLFFIMQGQLLDILEHPNQEKYRNQKILVVNIDDYAYLVPFVETENEIFLKTIIPNRKATKQYIR